MKCPLCDFESLEGADFCDECFSSLDQDLDLPVQRQVLFDRISKAKLRPSVMVSPGDSARSLVRTLKEKRVGSALVVEGKELVGIVTERDVLQKPAKPGLELEELEVKNIMTPSPEFLEENQTICDALNKMAVGNFRHVPIRKKSGDFSMFSVRDALAHLF